MIVSEKSRIAAAQADIDALVSHVGDAVPFAARCTRVEQGVKNGFRRNHLRCSLNRGHRLVGDQVHAAYDVLTKMAFCGSRFAARVNETFAIPAESPSGKTEIHHIKVRVKPFIHR